MSLVEASEARKARLIALRKRKAGEAEDANGCVALVVSMLCVMTDSMSWFSEETGPLQLKHRNFDPSTRTVRRHEGVGVETGDDNEDTVEHAVQGLQERIIAEDEERRAAELVRGTLAHLII